MALVARVQMEMGHEKVAAHPDFNAEPWRKLLSHPGIRWTRETHEGASPEKVSNSMFERTLYWERGIRAHLSFRRPCREPDSINTSEDCFLISLGDGLDGMTGRAHGGLSSALMDHITGHAAHYADPRPLSPATATMTIDYKRPIGTPCVVLVRGWLISFSGRKVWVKAAIEDSEGRQYATGKTLFILAKPEKL